MGLIMLGLVAALFHLFRIDAAEADSFVRVHLPIHVGAWELLRQILLVVGAIFLAVVAYIGKRWLFAVLEGSLILWGLLFFLQDPLILWSSRIVIFVATWIVLWQLKLFNRDNIWGVLGIEALGTGYLSGLFLMHFLGGLLLCVYSLQGMRASDRQVAVVSKFWLVLNIPFALLSLFESVIQMRLWLV